MAPLARPRAQPVPLLLGAIAACASASAPSSAGSSAGTCHLAAHDPWFVRHIEYVHLENWLLAVLAVITLVFEVTFHRARHWAHHRQSIAEHRSHTEARDHEKHDFRAFTKPLFGTLMEKAAGELMVLGFLAWVIWSFARAGFFEFIVCELQAFDLILLPGDAHDYVETVEDVHIHLFHTMMMFVIIMAIAIFLIETKQKQWRTLNDKIIHGYQAGRTIRMLTDKETDKEHFRRFAHSRKLLFRRLTRWYASETALDEDLDESLSHIMNHLEKSAEFDKRHMTVVLDRWFPFDQFASLQAAFLVEDLLMIKVHTWAYLAAGFLVSAVLVRFTNWIGWHFIIISIQLPIALGLGLTFPVVASFFSNSEKDITKEWSEDFQELEKLEGESLELPLSRVEEFPVTWVQLTIFFWCYNVVRIVASNHWWQTDWEVAVAALVVGATSIPMLGIAVGILLTKMSIWLARGDLKLQSYHQSWLIAICGRKLTEIHRRSAKKARKDHRGHQGDLHEAEGRGSLHEI